MSMVSWGDVLEVGTQQARALPSLSSRAGKAQLGGCPLRDRRGGETAQQGPEAAGWPQIFLQEILPAEYMPPLCCPSASSYVLLKQTKAALGRAHLNAVT